MLDSFDRSITYMRISVTDRCNLRCTYCMPEEGVRLLDHAQILSYEQITDIARAAARLGIEKIRLTGGEPLVRRHLHRLVRSLKAVPGISEVALTTNGLLLPRFAPELREAGLDRINISLDTLDPDRYRHLTRIGSLTEALAGIDAAISAGFQPLKINMVLIPGVNETDVPAMKSFCREKGLVLQRIRHYQLNTAASIRPTYEAERPLPCRSCNRIRLTADGMLKACLFSNEEIRVELNDPERSLREAILSKPPRGNWCDNRQNWQIGG